MISEYVIDRASSLAYSAAVNTTVSGGVLAASNYLLRHVKGSPCHCRTDNFTPITTSTSFITKIGKSALVGGAAAMVLHEVLASPNFYDYNQRTALWLHSEDANASGALGAFAGAAWGLATLHIDSQTPNAKLVRQAAAVTFGAVVGGGTATVELGFLVVRYALAQL